MDFSTDLFLEYKKRPGRASLARLLERHQDAVYTLCYQVLHHPQDAEDACQEILLEVSRQVDSIDEPAKFAGWLYRTALHSALDFKRQRGRRRIREAGAVAAPASEPARETAEALHRGLAGLDETSRTLVVEHYFGRRPLRELAAERGCSEVAVWKRIESARERLKKVLGSATVAALEGIATVPAPAGMVPKALGIAGGLAMATKVGIKLAIVAPLVLLAGAGTVLVARRSELPPPPSVEARKPAAQTPAKRAAPPMAPAGVVATAPTSAQVVPPAPRVRKPYPFKDPTIGHPAAAVRTYMTLASTKVTLDMQDVPLSEILKELRAVTGLTFVAGIDLDREMISFKVAQIVADGALKLMLQPRGKSYEILDDGSVRIDVAERIRGGFEKVGGEATAHLLGLKRIGEELDKGWDGVSWDDPTASIEAVLQKKRIVATQGETTLDHEFQRLRELGVHVYVHGQTRIVGGRVQRAEFMGKPFLQVVQERSLRDHVQELARMHGLVAFPINGLVTFTDEETAATFRAQVEEPRRAHEQLLEILKRPVAGSGTSDVPDFLDSVGRTHGLSAVPAEAAWNSSATLSLPAGTTLRQALDQLKTQGFRWAARDGKLYVLK